MPDLRSAGCGWPNGPTNDDILKLPSPNLLILSSEHWHVRKAEAAGKQVLFRAIARNGYRPAELDYDAKRYVSEILRDIPEGGVSSFIPFNELDLNYERGDGEDDFADLEARYKKLGDFQARVVNRLRKEMNADIHYGAWTPDHSALDYLEYWKSAAESCDVIDFHSYESLEKIRGQYEAYRATFPTRRLALTEWHCSGDIGEERRVLGWLSEIMAEDPLFDGAYFFIWRWDNPADWWRDSYDIQHDQGRIDLFMNPPVAPSTVEPAPEEKPLATDYREIARADAVSAGVPPEMFVKQIEKESGFRTHDAAGNVLTSSGGAIGIAQIIPKWHPTVDPTDPIAALAYAVGLMAGHYRRFGTWRKALAAYNWGPGNVGGYTKPNGTVVPPWDGRRETISAQGRRYLDVILGGGWPEPTEATVPRPGQPAPQRPAVVYEDFRDPAPYGLGVISATPKGFLMHGSRSGKAGNPIDAEYRGTAGYEQSNRQREADGTPWKLGWQATIGNRKVALHMTPREWGHHAGGASRHYIGVEFAQGTEGDAITDDQVAAFVDYARTRVLTVWPDMPMTFKSHAEAEASGETGVTYGKTDVFRLGSKHMDDLRARIMAALGSSQEVGEDVTREEADALKAENAQLRGQVAESMAERNDALQARNSLIEGFAHAADIEGDKIQAALDAIRQTRTLRIGARPS